MVSKTKQHNSILIGRCSCDQPVKYTFYWCEEIIEKAKELGIDVIDLKNENFVENKMGKHIIEHNPKFIFLNGHGDEFSARGYNQSFVITANKNGYLLKEKIAHIIPCKTGAFLAQSAMDKGCLGYIGYKNFFYIWYLEEDPEKDIISKMFQEAVNITSITLMSGGSVKEAFNKAQEIYEKRIDDCKGRYLNPKTTDRKDYLQEVISTLLWNKKHQIYLSILD